MLIIKIQEESNGAHNNQIVSIGLTTVPHGWAIVPNYIEIPETFPFVNIEVDGQVVTSMTAGVVPPIPPQPDPPDPPQPDPQPTEDIWGELADAIKQGVNQA